MTFNICWISLLCYTCVWTFWLWWIYLIAFCPLKTKLFKAVVFCMVILCKIFWFITFFTCVLTQMTFVSWFWCLSYIVDKVYHMWLISLIVHISFVKIILLMCSFCRTWMPFMPFKDTESTCNCLLTLYLKWKDKDTESWDYNYSMSQVIASITFWWFFNKNTHTCE